MRYQNFIMTSLFVLMCHFALCISCKFRLKACRILPAQSQLTIGFPHKPHNNIFECLGGASGFLEFRVLGLRVPTFLTIKAGVSAMFLFLEGRVLGLRVSNFLTMKKWISALLFVFRV